MSKTRIKYICSNCGYESLRWLGKCPECDSWNTFTEELVEVKKNRSNAKINRSASVFTINEIPADEDERIKTNINEFDRVLGEE